MIYQNRVCLTRAEFAAWVLWAFFFGCSFIGAIVYLAGSAT